MLDFPVLDVDQLSFERMALALGGVPVLASE